MVLQIQRSRATECRNHVSGGDTSMSHIWNTPRHPKVTTYANPSWKEGYIGEHDSIVFKRVMWITSCYNTLDGISAESTQYRILGTYGECQDVHLRLLPSPLSSHRLCFIVSLRLLLYHLHSFPPSPSLLLSYFLWLQQLPNAADCTGATRSLHLLFTFFLIQPIRWYMKNRILITVKNWILHSCRQTLTFFITTS